MRYEARVQIYDALGQVVIAAIVWDSHERDKDGVGVAYTRALTVEGVGEDNPAKWLRRALEDLREAL